VKRKEKNRKKLKEKKPFTRLGGPKPAGPLRCAVHASPAALPHPLTGVVDPRVSHLVLITQALGHRLVGPNSQFLSPHPSRELVTEMTTSARHLWKIVLAGHPSLVRTWPPVYKSSGPVTFVDHRLDAWPTSRCTEGWR
jgi:hypothetical protein